MARNLLLCFVLLLGLFCSAQEICTNGIDDDNDGLIDLNDSDCNCNQSVAVPSLIPNPSFEAYDYCPSFISQLDAAETWIQATVPTTDYFNTCGYVNDAGMTPFPDGNAAVGAFFVPGWQEYLGACLLNPMQAGTNYQLQFSVASKPATGWVMLANNGDIYYGNVNLTLYGTSNCNSLPLDTYGCPSVASPDWIELGYINYTPSGTWSTVTISFTPDININAIMLGSPCDLPSDYIPFGGSGNLGNPYFYFDNLVLNRSAIFEIDNTISSSGDPCNNNVVLNTTAVNSAFSYQWYLNGVAIPNETAPTFVVVDFSPTASYSLRVAVDNFCNVSNSLVLNSIIPAPPVVATPLSFCQNQMASPLTATGSNLKWYNTPTGGTGSSIAPTPSTLVPGTFTYYVSQTCGLESPRALITVVINPQIPPGFASISPICQGSNPPVLEITSPNDIVGTWFPNSINTNQSGSYTFIPNASQCASRQVLAVEIIPLIDFFISGGCVGPSYILQANVTNSKTDLEGLSFSWKDPSGNAIGLNNPQINLSQIIASSPNIEVFPATYSLQITDENGCDSFQNFEVEKVFCSIPKGISPNDDGDNDVFDLTGLGVKQLTIFNRYGVTVYKKNQYADEWKGQSDSGGELPDATYFYLAEFENEKPKTGWVYLIR